MTASAGFATRSPATFRIPDNARFQKLTLRYRYPISWALANASVRFRTPSLTMADDR